MKIDILTLFPEMFSCLNHSIIGRAIDLGLISIDSVNIRDFSENKHNKVDDYPYGGGAGMVLQPQPVYRAIQSVKEKQSRIIYLSPKGKLLNQDLANELSKEKHLVLLCGHYEGIDNRIIENYITDEISIGDYVLTGGELASMVLIDCVARLITGVLGKDESYIDESHYDGLLEYPQYTRPRSFNGFHIPEILLSGNHQKIEYWRKFQALKITYLNRPDLLDNKNLDDEEREMLKQIKSEQGAK